MVRVPLASQDFIFCVVNIKEKKEKQPTGENQNYRLNWKQRKFRWERTKLGLRTPEETKKERKKKAYKFDGFPLMFDVDKSNIWMNQSETHKLKIILKVNFEKFSLLLDFQVSE